MPKGDGAARKMALANLKDPYKTLGIARSATPDDRKARHKHHPHCSKDRPALPGVPRHPAKQKAKGHRDQQDRQPLRKV